MQEAGRGKEPEPEAAQVQMVHRMDQVRVLAPGRREAGAIDGVTVPVLGLVGVSVRALVGPVPVAVAASASAPAPALVPVPGLVQVLGLVLVLVLVRGSGQVLVLVREEMDLEALEHANTVARAEVLPMKAVPINT